ncbi:hypothetical protein [Gulosibacter molinativorax]|uniref:CD225/dispanin family protein n=1 Tax=Gulosibacter molinativorax TaxID=256821 RepID=A0ABT7CB16_9MICO|nr:hypothetical protein [Gulosibacter molinativorax]MDJ1371836.1 hypothetical protein [Gulosibacter molinativorax]QUY60792.1 Hypothetical protein GMOLON4_63 [Gulosibacter molinativorax]
MAQYQPYQQPHAQPHYAVQPYQRHPEETDSLGSWMLAVFLMMIPVVGFIYLLVLAFGGTESVAKKNYARASLLWSAILIVLMIVAAIIMATAGIAFFSGLEEPSSVTNY